MDDSLNERKERQENEVEALKSIFDQNFKDCRECNPWQVWRPPEFEVQILQENTTQGYSQVTSGWLRLIMTILTSDWSGLRLGVAEGQVLSGVSR